MVLTPALARLLKLYHALDMHNSPLPECTGSHITSLLVTTLFLELIKHLLAGLSAGLWWGKAEVSRDNSGTGEELVKLVIGDASLTLLISLNKANVLLLGVVLHLVETNVLCWDLANLADNMIESPLNKLVEARHTTGWASSGVQLIEKFLVGHLTLQSGYGAHWGKTISTRNSSHFLEEAIKLLQVDEPILVNIHITESEGTETKEFTLLAANTRCHSSFCPILEGGLAVTPMICPPGAGSCKRPGGGRLRNGPHRCKHDGWLVRRN